MFKWKISRIFILTVAACLLVSSCNIEHNESDPESSAPRQSKSELKEDQLKSGKHRGLPNVSCSILEDGSPELTRVTVYSSGDKRDLSKVGITDMYGIDVLTSQVAARTGGPIEIDYPEDLKVIVEFEYDENELRGLDENNMSLIYFDEDTGFYDDVFNVVDTETNTLVFYPEKSGEYIMIGASSFSDIIAGNYETPDYSEYESDWERNYDTGDIMHLVDTECALDNAQNFDVATPEQLASVVWYTNVYAQPDECLEINITDDIDLSDYDWEPMSIDGGFNGIINGNNHVISNLSIEIDQMGLSVGFIGHANYLTVNDLSFTDAHISGGNYTGILCGQVYGAHISNVQVSGNVEGSGEAGTILGREASSAFENCSTDVTVNGEPNEYYSHYLEHLDTVVVEQVLDISISSDGICTINDDWKSIYNNVYWHIAINGETVETIGWEGETSVDLFENYPHQSGDVYTVYVQYHDGYYYVPCSEIVEITAE